MAKREMTRSRRSRFFPTYSNGYFLLCLCILVISVLNHWKVEASSIIDAAEKMYPNSEEREKNLIASLNTLKNMREEAKQLGEKNHMHKTIESSTVLCVSFVEPSFKHMAVAGSFFAAFQYDIIAFTSSSNIYLPIYSIEIYTHSQSLT